jgi:predicted GNAT family N-acyltransferase
MRQVAVNDKSQRSGIGSRLVAYSEEYAREHGYETMELNARQTAVPFYLRLGYEITGDPFTEVGLPHRKMQKRLV